MEFTTDVLVKYLRDSVLVQDPTMGEDEIWLTMSDYDLAIVLEVAKNRDFPHQAMSSLSGGVVYPLLLVAKKELYYRLAVKSAPKYDLKGDDAGELKRQQRFQHFLDLVKQTDEELNTYMKNGYLGEDGIGDLDGEEGTSHNKVYTKDILSSTRYFSKRNYGMYKSPSVSVTVEGVDSSKVHLKWNAKDIHVFAGYTVYLSTKGTIYDEFTHLIDSEARVAFSTADQRKTTCEITGLQPNTRYYVLVVCAEANGIKGYDDTVFETYAPRGGVIDNA